jgi:hypothetical protein
MSRLNLPKSRHGKGYNNRFLAKNDIHLTSPFKKTIRQLAACTLLRRQSIPDYTEAAFHRECIFEREERKHTGFEKRLHIL